MARIYLKDIRVGAAKGYDEKIDLLYGYNATMERVNAPFLKKIDLDDCDDWTNEPDPEADPNADPEGEEVTEVEQIAAPTVASADASEAVNAALEAAKKRKADREAKKAAEVEAKNGD